MDNKTVEPHQAQQPISTSPKLRLLRRPIQRPLQQTIQVMPDDHSKLVPPLPIPNRTVKRLCADDSASTRVKVGHRQAKLLRFKQKGPPHRGPFCVTNPTPRITRYCRQPNTKLVTYYLLA